MKDLTPLEQEVYDWLTEDDDPHGNYHDLQQGGCQSGTVGMLIYYSDTVPFYKRHQQEIDAMLYELCRDIGSNPWDLFKDKWDDEDPFAREYLNQNLLAWFGFEETAYRLVENDHILRGYGDEDEDDLDTDNEDGDSDE
jgi:hypothetical protein